MTTLRKVLVRRIATPVLLSLIFSVVSFNSASAGPDCDKKPDHPSCSGGGDPGGGDACAASMTFPTFVYWNEQGESGSADLTLSDADGACSEVLTTWDTNFDFPGEEALYFDDDTDWGRVIWTNRGINGQQILLIEFQVSSNNTVTVREDTTLLAQVDIADADDSIVDLDIASNGDTMIFIYHWPPNPGNTTNAPGNTVYMASIDGCVAETWIVADSTGCSGMATELLSWGPFLNGDGPYFSGIMFNGDDSKIFLDQFLNAWGPGSGTYVAEQIGGVWTSTYTPQLIFPSDTASINHDESGVRDVLVSGNGSSTNPCSELIVVDVEDCRSLDHDDTCVAIGGSHILGWKASWLDDGRLVYQERVLKRRGKNFSCGTGDISISDPFDVNTVPINLFGGSDPRGWR